MFVRFETAETDTASQGYHVADPELNNNKTHLTSTMEVVKLGDTVVASDQQTQNLDQDATFIIQPPSTPTLNLTQELRDKILSFLLVSSHAVPLSLKTALKMGEWAPTGWKNFSLNGPYLTSTELASQFTILCLVSKTMRQDARRILFGGNEWHLKISLPRPTHSIIPVPVGHLKDVKLHEGQSLGGMDTALYIAKLWGEEALHQMQNIRVLLVGEHRDTEVHTQKAVLGLVNILQRGGDIRRLVIEWRNDYERNQLVAFDTLYELDEVVEKLEEMIEDTSRLEFGTRTGVREGEDWEERQLQSISLLEDWAKEERRALHHFEALRNVREVRVMGCVTDEYAKWLEQCIRSDDGPVPAFERNRHVQVSEDHPERTRRVTSAADNER